VISGHYHQIRRVASDRQRPLPGRTGFPRLEYRIAVIVAVLNVRLVTDLKDDIFALIMIGNWLRGNCQKATIEISG
jgi:hypothetical protein